MKNARASGGRGVSRPVWDSIVPALEALEARLLLDGEAPVFMDTAGYSYLIDPDGRALTLGVDGYDADGDAVAITVGSVSPGLHIEVHQDRPCVRLHFVDSGGAEVYGDIVVQLFDDLAPAAAERFITLATNAVNGDGSLDPAGVPFYTDVKVHRVIDGFMIQTGDAVEGDGTGGSPLGDFGDPIGADIDPTLGYSASGALGMAHAAALSTNDCQFFITDGTAHHLDGVHFIFGQVISGWGVLDALSQVETTGSNGLVVDPPLLQYVEIIDPADCNQDGTITLTADETFTGQGSFTITLDDGNGNTTDQTITISARAALGETRINVAPGESYDFTPTHSDAGSFQAAYSVLTAAAATYVTMDSDTYEFHIDVPSGATIPEFDVNVTFIETGYANSETVARTFTVAPAGDRPVIEDIPTQFVTPGETVSLTPTITDDGPTELNVTVEADRDGVVVHFDQDTYEITFTVPRGLVGAFDLIITASEEGFDQRDPIIYEAIQVVSQSAGEAVPALGGAATSLYGQTMATWQLGDMLYVANYTPGIEIFDISDPSSPVKVGEFATDGQAWDLQVIETTRSGGDALVAFVGCLETGVVVLDVTDPGNIVQVDGLPTYSYTVSLDVVGDLLFQCDWQAGLNVYDISDPYRIVEADSVYQLDVLSYVLYAIGCTGEGDVAYLADWGDETFAGVYMLDISDPTNVSVLGAYVMEGASYPWDVDVQDGRLYILGSTGLTVLDVTDPAAPVLLGFEPMTSKGFGKLAVQGNTAVVTTDNGFATFDVSDPADIRQSYAFSCLVGYYGGTPSFLGDRLALPCGQDGVVLLDAHRPVEAVFMGTNRKLTFPSGRTVTVRVSSAGQAWVYEDELDPEAIALLEVLGSTARTSVTVTSTNGNALIGDVHVFSALGSFTGRTTDLLGDFTADGTIGRLVLNDVAGGHTIDLNAADGAVGSRATVTIALGLVADTVIDTHGLPIYSLTVTEWQAVDAQSGDELVDEIRAPWIGSLKSTGRRANAYRGIEASQGDFQAGLTLSGVGRTAGKNVLGSATVAGEIACTWDIEGPVGRIRASSTGATWVLDAEGAVQSVSTTAGLAGSLTALYFGSIYARGDLAADITADGAHPTRRTSIYALTAGSVRDVSLNLPGGVRMITVVEWLDTDATPDTVAVAWIGRLRTQGRTENLAKGIEGSDGDFQPNLTLTGAGVDEGRSLLAGASILGSVGGSTWQIDGRATRIAIGAADGWTATMEALRTLTAGDVDLADVTVADALGTVRAVRWTDGKLEANTLGGLRVTGRRARAGVPAIPGDFGAALEVAGDGLTGRQKALGYATVAGTLGQTGRDTTIHGNAGRLRLGAVGARVTVDGNVPTVTIGEAMALVPPLGGADGELHVGGTGRVTAARRRIGLANGSIYANDSYQLEEDLRHYNTDAAEWHYDVTYRLDGRRDADTSTVTATETGVDAYTVQAVSDSLTYASDTTSHLSDVGGEVVVHEWIRAFSDTDGFEVTFDNGLAIAPQFIPMVQASTSTDTFTGTFAMTNVGELVEGTCAGTATVVTKLLAHETVTVPAGTFLAVKAQSITTVTGGTVSYEIDGQPLTGTLTLTEKQTWWLVPDVGVVKSVTTVTYRVRGPGLGTKTHTLSATQVLTDTSLL